jgi:hypothetical protein
MCTKDTPTFPYLSTKLRKLRGKSISAKPNKVVTYPMSRVHGWKLYELLDHENCYIKLSTAICEETSISVSDVHDRTGTEIHPCNYMTKISHGDKVAMEVILKLCVLIFLFSFS